MTTTYCTQADIESILSTAGVLATIDDDETGTAAAGETAYVTNAIERAAVKINAAVSRQYLLADVTANAWLKWANAILAAEMLASRRGNPAPQSLMDDAKEILEKLELIRWGRDQLPEQAPSFDYLPTVTNYQVEPGQATQPIRVDRDESTGSDPEGNRKRYYANTGYYR